MDCLLLQPQRQQQMFLPPNLMNYSLSCKLLKPKTLLSSPFQFRFFCSATQQLEKRNEAFQAPSGKPSSISRANVEILKENWLSSLSWSAPLEINGLEAKDGIESINVGSKWVIGVDPDVSGALALLKSDNSGCTAEVFDSPYVQVSVGKTCRRRLDARSIVQLVQSFNAPIGTIAYVEQSTPFPQDGKQGWWSGGFGYGLWIGILVASGFSVVPVPSNVWKKEFELAGSRSSKDKSRELAVQLFPSLSAMLKRKKDHGRAEALLIAAYGKGLNTKSDESSGSDMVLKL